MGEPESSLFSTDLFCEESLEREVRGVRKREEREDVDLVGFFMGFIRAR